MAVKFGRRCAEGVNVQPQPADDGQIRDVVLVIEDDEDVRALLGSHLARLGYHVRQAGTGEQGLAMATAEPPSVVLLDVLLPGIDGLEVARRLRADPTTSACRIVISSVLDGADFSGTPVDALLPKPFSRRDVQSVMATVTTRQSATEREAPC